MKQPNPIGRKEQKSRLVHVLHKLTNAGKAALAKIDRPTKAQAMGALAVGATFKFPGSGRRYTVLSSGAVVRTEQKPWSNKAEHKAHKRARRLARESGTTVPLSPVAQRPAATLGIAAATRLLAGPDREQKSQQQSGGNDPHPNGVSLAHGLEGNPS